ncbi:MAG: hypothetical protein JWO65_1345, partial [Sphingomonas bacterium]|nr:hypothetical protein [Sphingomonas bacterium]
MQAPQSAAPAISAADDDGNAGGADTSALRGFVFALFFVFGGITSLN